MHSNSIFPDRRFAAALGFGGVAPFVLLMFACWVVHPDWLGYFVKGQLAYGIAILSFLGGVHWGAALIAGDLTAEQARRALAWSVVPALIGWSATLMGGFGFAALMAGFVAAYQTDKRLYVWYRMPDWFLPLRLKLTVAVVAALALTVVAVNIRG